MSGRDVTKVTAGILLLISLIPLVGCDELWCYECGTDVEGRPDCEAFHTASTWTPFWRKCPADSVCVRTRPAWKHPNPEKATVRGCSPRISLQGAVHREGCWTHPSLSSSLTCYCTSTLCNTAPTHTHTPLLTLAGLAVARGLGFVWRGA